MPPFQKTPQTFAKENARATNLRGSRKPSKDIEIVPSHWGDDLVAKYAELSGDVHCRWEIIRKIYRNSAVAQIVIDSISNTVSSLDWNVVPTDASDYWKSMARISRNEIINACGRAGGYEQMIQAFTQDILVNPTGHFAQLVYDGNGMPYEIGGIGERQPRPYYRIGSETFWDASATLVTRETSFPDGIWWSDNFVYTLPNKYYYQTVDDARGDGCFLIGHSKAEKARVRIWLSATLEEYFQRVASGTDQSGVLVMNNLAYKTLADQVAKRKQVRKLPTQNSDDQGGILYVYNIGDKPGDAKWVSFRSFPEGLDIAKLLSMAEDMVAAGFGVKSWRVDPSGSGAEGKFGNAKKAVQLDAQEPGVQWVMAMWKNLINNVFFSRMPLQFQWVVGVSAMDSIKLENALKVVQAVSQTTGWLDSDAQKRFAIDLGLPRRVLAEDTGVASSMEGLTKTGGVHSVVSRIISGIDNAFDEYGLDAERMESIEAALSAVCGARFIEKCQRIPGSIAFDAEMASFRSDLGSSLKDLRVRAETVGRQYAVGAVTLDQIKLGFASEVVALANFVG